MTSRTMIRAALLAASLGVAGAASAQAFNGPYIGGQIGWQQDRSKANLGLVDSIGGVRQDANKSAFAGGVFAGYNALVGQQFVLGGEVGIDWGGKNIAISPIGGDEVKAKRDISVVARAGALVTPQTLVYAKGGYANGRYRFSSGDLGMSSNRDGWTLGAGVEQAITPNITARIEYSYVNYGNVDDAYRSLGYINASDSSMKQNKVMVGAAFHF